MPINENLGSHLAWRTEGNNLFRGGSSEFVKSVVLFGQKLQKRLGFPSRSYQTRTLGPDTEIKSYKMVRAENSPISTKSPFLPLLLGRISRIIMNSSTVVTYFNKEEELDHYLFVI